MLNEWLNKWMKNFNDFFPPNFRIFTLYSKSLPLDLACRVWDVFCRDGEEFLFRTGLGILRLYEDILLQMDFIHIAQFLTKLPEDITSEKLFSCIAAIQMQNSTKKWTQVEWHFPTSNRCTKSLFLIKKKKLTICQMLVLKFKKKL